MNTKLELTQSEVEAVMNYIWTHCRSSPEGKGYKVWEKMFEFVNAEEVQPGLYEVQEI